MEKKKKTGCLGSRSQCKHSVVSCCCSPKCPMTSFLAFPEHSGLTQPAYLSRTEWQSPPFLTRIRPSRPENFSRPTISHLPSWGLSLPSPIRLWRLWVGHAVPLSRDPVAYGSDQDLPSSKSYFTSFNGDSGSKEREEGVTHSL